MTLINFLSRVHFADGIIEDALHSELEANFKTRPLIVARDSRMSNLSAERFYAGFPRCTDPVLFTDVPPAPTETALRHVADLYRENDCDVLVAYGASQVIDLAKAARVAIAYEGPIHTRAASEGGSRRINGDLPDLYAVPSILGFPGAINDQVRVTLDDGRNILLWSRNLIPAIVICDPTLSLTASRAETASAAAGILSNAIDTVYSPRYHPPSDGLALDALRRLILNIKAALEEDNLPARRELIAAGLNGALANQKGPCVIDALSNAVCRTACAPPQPGTVAGAVIAHLVAVYEDRDATRGGPVKQALCIDDHYRLADGLKAMLSDWSVPQKLSDLSIGVSALGAATEMAAQDFALTSGPRNFTRSEIRKVLIRAHQGA